MQEEIDLTACIRGDKRAWDALVERAVSVIYAAVRKVVAARGRTAADEIDDIVQDVFTKLVRDDYRLLRQFDPAKASLVTYLTLIARSTALDALRRRSLSAVELREASRAAVALDPPHAEPRAAVGSSVPLETLSERQRLILHLLFDRDMSVTEAAAVLGVDPQTIRSGKHKALSKLRQVLEPGDETAGPFVERK